MKRTMKYEDKKGFISVVEFNSSELLTLKMSIIEQIKKLKESREVLKKYDYALDYINEKIETLERFVNL